MAMLKIFCVRDNAVEAYMRPFYQVTRAAAIRDFTEACSQGDSPFAKHPSDYTLFEIGVFDETTGILEGGEPSRVIGALECVSAKS